MNASGTAKIHLADTSAWIPYFRRPFRSRLRDRIHELALRRTLATCDMVGLELLRAARDDADYTFMYRELGTGVLLPTDERVWAEAIALGRRLRRAGVGIEVPDLLIAATAIVHGATLFHADRNFERVAEHSELQTEPVFDLL